MKRLIFTFILLGAISFAKASNTTLYPNPATTEFTVKVDKHKKIKTLNVYNYLGVKITSIEYTYGVELMANISNLKTGKYLVSINYWDGSREVLPMIKK
tara:strand:+ start:99 stop:395 length:297 start_codon:yes stop_codon:yes gene_type:complete